MARMLAVILLLSAFLLMLSSRESKCFRKRRLAWSNLLATLREQECYVNKIDVVNAHRPG